MVGPYAQPFSVQYLSFCGKPIIQVVALRRASVKPSVVGIYLDRLLTGCPELARRKLARSPCPWSTDDVSALITYPAKDKLVKLFCLSRIWKNASFGLA
jgi:hypothetical protein